MQVNTDMEIDHLLLLDDLAKNCIDEYHLERQFVTALSSMTHGQRDQVPAYLYEALASLHPSELISYERVCRYVSDRVRVARLEHAETELQALVRKIRAVLR